MKKDKQIIIRLSEDEKKSFERAAELSGLGVSTWARLQLRTASEAKLKEVGEIPEFMKNNSATN